MPHPPPELGDKERLLGYQFLRMRGNWEAWVLRRVESVEFETAASIRRRVSVDFRLDPRLLGPPQFCWGKDAMHYVPIGLLQKHALTRFDVFDEDGTALPVMTRKKNALIMASALAGLAQALIATRLQAEESERAGVKPPKLLVPKPLEDEFWRLAYYNCTNRGDPDDAQTVYRRLLVRPASEPVPVGQWSWALQEDGRWKASVSDDMWRWALQNDEEFMKLASDVARLFPISVPVRDEHGRRRVIKFSYTQHLTHPESRWTGRIKGAAAGIRVARAWNWCEDFLERIPPHDASRDEWVPEDFETGTSSDAVSLRAKLLRWLGWAAVLLPLEAPAVGHGRSYHLDLIVPPGLQIRRAQLVIKRPRVEPDELPAKRGHRSVRAVHLYVPGTGQHATGLAKLYFRPESALIARGATIAAALTTLALILLYEYAADIDTARAQTAAAILVLFPGLLAAYAARGEEHPLATRLAFGVRTVALLPGVLAAAGAALLVVDQVRTPLGCALPWAAGAVTLVLAIGWRLGGRGRPHPRAVGGKR